MSAVLYKTIQYSLSDDAKLFDYRELFHTTRELSKIEAVVPLRARAIQRESAIEEVLNQNPKGLFERDINFGEKAKALYAQDPWTCPDTPSEMSVFAQMNLNVSLLQQFSYEDKKTIKIIDQKDSALLVILPLPLPPPLPAQSPSPPPPPPPPSLSPPQAPPHHITTLPHPSTKKTKLRARLSAFMRYGAASIYRLMHKKLTKITK